VIGAALRALAARLAARAGRIALAVGGVFAAYQLLIAVVLSLGLGGRPTYARFYPVWDNARRILAGTPSATDVVTLLAREPILEYGRLHPKFGAAVWSFELTWSSLLFFLSFATLLGVYLGLAGGRTGWGTLGSLGGAGVVGLFGASVSSLTHCGLGSFGVLLSLVGISATTIQWFGRLEPALIVAGYALVLLAIAGRAAALASAAAPALAADRAHAH
jgi:hypothetical protein